MIKEFFLEVDKRWRPIGGEPYKLQVIGSAALMLQFDSQRGTKDGDVLETRAMTEELKKKLIELAGKGTDLHTRNGIFLDVVVGGPPSSTQATIPSCQRIEKREAFRI